PTPRPDQRAAAHRSKCRPCADQEPRQQRLMGTLAIRRTQRARGTGGRWVGRLWWYVAAPWLIGPRGCGARAELPVRDRRLDAGALCGRGRNTQVVAIELQRRSTVSGAFQPVRLRDVEQQLWGLRE